MHRYQMPQIEKIMSGSCSATPKTPRNVFKKVMALFGLGVGIIIKNPKKNQKNLIISLFHPWNFKKIFLFKLV